MKGSKTKRIGAVLKLCRKEEKWEININSVVGTERWSDRISLTSKG